VSLKKEQNQVRAVEKSRATWRSKAEAEERRAEAAEQQVASLSAELAALKKRSE
jgi:predicted  nucleic acid-binding Zn-ribbon protein